MNKISHYKATYLHETPRGDNASRDTKNPSMWINSEVFMGMNDNAIIRQVRDIGGFPISIEKTKPSTAKVGKDYRIKFLIAIQFGVQNGQSAGAALERLIESERWPLRGQLDPAMRLLKAGASFSEAMSIIGFYDETTLSILEAGEQTGTLRQSLEAAVMHQERSDTSTALIRGSMIMICIDIAFALSSVLSSRFGMLPAMEAQGFKSEDPAEIASFHRAVDLAYLSNDIMLVVSFILIGAGIWGYHQHKFGSPEMRHKTSLLMTKIPYLGQAILHSAMSATTGVMGRLLQGGVLFLQAAEIAKRGTKLTFVRNYWDNCTRQVMAGQPLGASLAVDPMTNSEQRVLASHGNREQLAQVFSRIAEFREKEAAVMNKKFIFWGFVSSFLYSCVGIAMTLYVNWVQIRSVMSSSGV